MVVFETSLSVGGRVPVVNGGSRGALLVPGNGKRASTLNQPGHRLHAEMNCFQNIMKKPAPERWLWNLRRFKVRLRREAVKR
jgi:hypothetical protein